ncbi:oxidoreductase domain protein [Sporothrix brasiliensis 5110]|uniref:Oxidoreductase domain protein n=1 Tax=Sporothrix brasiliensis 5110 TaxID=1398154 RepID=A0A0C2IH74_9PEZI|nr:oxidoreductase domain protein [Sporothrix brasiliensis 5110]KIH86380.1 oxidoreductase domain protein [Sporothrix brasiliensis 5110]
MGSVPKVKRYVLVGTGVRSAFYYESILRDFKDSAKLCAICDTNTTRMNAINDHIEEISGERVATYKAEDFDKMVKEQEADVVIVTTIDRVHHIYCIRAMELGCDAITEKPMTIDAEKLQLMIDAEKRTGKHVRVLFNYRYAPHHTKVRELIASGVIGEVSTVHMDWILDCAHGSDFMRRWHRDKANSGGIQMHKSIHHFDLVHFWLGTEPETVYCVGGLRFYGKENAEARGVANLGERYLNNEAAKEDPFAFDIGASPRLKKLYLDAEHEDGYIRDRNCFTEGITIEDTLSMIVTYKNRATMTYNTYAFAPWEGYRCVFNGTKGRLEINVFETGYSAAGDPIASKVIEQQRDYVQGGVEETKIIVYPLFAEPYAVDVVKAEGGHGGGDPVLLRDVLVGDKEDEFKRAAFIRDGGNAVLVGVGANISMESGAPVKIQELVKW